MSKRGELTTEIQEMAKSFLKREINTTELRLYPYIDFTMKNTHKMDVIRINQEEREILSKLKDEGHLDRHMNGDGKIEISVTKKFYEFINRVLWLGYVSIDI